MGRVSPNPMVGAVIVNNGKIISEGYHAQYGDHHAEIVAIKNAKSDITGATMYVTLEPCSHYGKTPPCTHAIIQAQIQRVVIGCIDPDPLVNMKGFNALKKHGIEVQIGPLEAECQELIAGFTRHRQFGIPLTTIKFAQSLDGRIATATGHSRWISSQTSLKFAHELRRQHDAVMVGIGTVLADDPQLNLRHVTGVNPMRIVIDSKLRIPLSSRLLTASDISKTILVTTASAPASKIEQIRNNGVQIIIAEQNGAHQIDIVALWKKLGSRGITTLLVEGGAELITSILKNRLADRVVVFVAPIIIGSGVPAIKNLSILQIGNSIKISETEWHRSDRDMIVKGSLIYPEQEP
ncbi:bifunctional diaminohydroxyphosphoribosylaminopyrimidine deaminase/5-amino-6-(5-phosphoribosylamino)uracil reductase RibD [candidate division KSB1 bacterium]|nr:bifunctional diaminohydroxyphosphoribosylaminopyrimidine deaminase/5-amino-6-(5-phosphoribosylamino)uracil reductase RibD [candidate division KSB1 bacterium]